MHQDVVRPPRTAPLTNTPGSFGLLCERHFPRFAAVILLLAALNLGVRLNQEIVTDWDEALYAITAWESLQSGDWIGTTFLGELDYYNSKPPLNIWLIGLAFKTLGPSLLSLRVVSAVSAWITVLMLLVWSRRRFGALPSLAAGLVLSSSFGFIYVHSGRSGNADALFTLLVLLLVITLCAERERPWRRVWLGPIAASLFMLKGMAVLMPLAIVGGVLVLRPRAARGAPLPSLVAVLLGVLPCAAWAMARWSVDGFTFFYTMWRNDLLRISTEVLEGHAGTVLFYLNILQKNQYDWLVAAAVVYALYPVPWSRVRALASRGVDDTTLVLGVWAVVCFLIPTAMQTKLPWYLNPLYPPFALGTGWILARGLSQYGGSAPLRRGLATAVIVGALCVAEGKLVWYSFQARDVDRSVQGLLISERGRVVQAHVFKDQWSNSDVFVLEAIVHASGSVAVDVDDFLLKSQPGDYFVADPGLDHPALMLVRSLGSHALYQRTPGSDPGLIVTVGGAAGAPPAQRPQVTSARAARGS